MSHTKRIVPNDMKLSYLQLTRCYGGINKNGYVHKLKYK